MACGDDSEHLSPGEVPSLGEVVVRIDPATSSQCPHGGSVVSVGLDDNRNTVLDDAEVRQHTVVCLRAPIEQPPSPPQVVVRLVPEPAGEHCSEGGTAVQSGPDHNGNGQLDDAEVSHTDYVCNERLLTRFATEPPGAHCVAGGLAFFIGRDRDRDGELDDAEIEQTEYECSTILTRNVSVTSTAEISALAEIAVINGSLTISGDAIEQAALPRLQHIFGPLAVRNAAKLTRVEAPELRDIQGDQEIRATALLVTLDLPRLTRVSGSLTIENNAALLDLSGLPMLTEVGATVAINDNAALRSVASAISSIGSDLRLHGNPQLRQLTWTLLHPLQGFVARETALTTLQLTVAASIETPALGVASVSSNPALTSVTIDAAVMNSLFVDHNAMLTDFAVRGYEILGDVTIRTSPQLSGVRFEVPDNFSAFHMRGDFELWSPAQTLEANASGIVMHGVCSIFETRLTNLSSIRSAAILMVSGNAQLTAISGIEAGYLDVAGNSALTRIALGQSTLTGFTRIVHNAALEEVRLGSQRALASSVQIGFNPELQRIVAPTLEDIAGELSITDNPLLTTVTMEHLQDLQDLHLSRCPERTFFGLPMLTHGHFLSIYGNPGLHHLDFAALHSVGTFSIVDNSARPACEVAARLRAREWITRSFSAPIHPRSRRCSWGHIRGVCALLAPCHRGGCGRKSQGEPRARRT
jgi:hypothetical protein